MAVSVQAQQDRKHPTPGHCATTDHHSTATACPQKSPDSQQKQGNAKA